MGKKILLIGDLRTALNYGAVATSQELINSLFSKMCENDEVKFIDQRSYFSITPVEGWSDEPESYRKQQLERIVAQHNSVIYKIIKKIRSFKFYYVFRKLWRKGMKENSFQMESCVPKTFSEYSIYADKVLDNRILQYEKKQIEWADIILINSEGAIVHGSEPDGKYKLDARYVLFMAYLAKIIFDKECYIINHCVDPDNDDALEIISNIYPQMDGIYVREMFSYKNICNICGREVAKCVPDALFQFNKHEIEIRNELKQKIDFSKPYICIGDSSGFDSSLNMITWNIYDTMSKLICELKKITPQVIFIDGFMGWNSDIQKTVEGNHLICLNMCNCSYEELYVILKHAQIFISGRWHASILALLARTPILLWGADSFKTRALYDLIDYKYAFFDIATLPQQIQQVCKEVEKIIRQFNCEQYDKKVSELENKSKEIFEML